MVMVSVDGEDEEKNLTDDGGGDIKSRLPVSVEADVPGSREGIVDGEFGVFARRRVLVVIILGGGIGPGVDVRVDVAVLAGLIDNDLEAGGRRWNVDVKVLPFKSVK